MSQISFEPSATFEKTKSSMERKEEAVFNRHESDALSIGNKFISDHSPKVPSHFKTSAQKEYVEKPVILC